MKLSDYQSASDVQQFRCAIAPGKHCPMFGVSTVLRAIRGITVIYLGTTDCVFYAQKAFREFEVKQPGHGCARVIGAELTDRDLVFGLQEPLSRLIAEEIRRFPDNQIYLVTSCSIEVISEDIRGMTELLSRQYGRPITLIPTENFKTFSYYTGIENALAALALHLHPAKNRGGKSFNVLGARFRGGDTCEPVQLLQESGWEMRVNFPFQGDREALDALTEASFNLVIDNCALPLAEELQARFGMDFVRFDRKLDLRAVHDGYRQLERLTGLDFSAVSQAHEENIGLLQQKAYECIRGKTFFYSQILLYPFETCLFLAELGAKPLCIFLGSVIDRTDDARQALLQYGDPEVWRGAQSGAVLEKLREKRPDLYVGGMIAPEDLRGQNVLSVGLPVLPLDCGYRMIEQTLVHLTEAKEHENS